MSFLGNEGIKPTNNDATRTLRKSVNQRKINNGAKSRKDGFCRSRLISSHHNVAPKGPGYMAVPGTGLG